MAKIMVKIYKLTAKMTNGGQVLCWATNTFIKCLESRK